MDKVIRMMDATAGLLRALTPYAAAPVAAWLMARLLIG